METAPQASGYLHTIVPIASYCSVKALVTKPHHVCCPHRPQAPSTQSLLAVALLQWEWKGTTEEVVAGHRQYFTPAVNRSWSTYRWVGRTLGPTHPPGRPKPSTRIAKLGQVASARCQAVAQSPTCQSVGTTSFKITPRHTCIAYSDP